MTTIRERIEKGRVEEATELWKTAKGSVPPCCFEDKLVKGIWKRRCNWLNQWLTTEDFKVKCLECQKEIEKLLRNKK
jgi:hypothetical protein